MSAPARKFNKPFIMLGLRDVFDFKKEISKGKYRAQMQSYNFVLLLFAVYDGSFSLLDLED